VGTSLSGLCQELLGAVADSGLDLALEESSRERKLSLDSRMVRSDVQRSGDPEPCRVEAELAGIPTPRLAKTGDLVTEIAFQVLEQVLYAFQRIFLTQVMRHRYSHSRHGFSLRLEKNGVTPLFMLVRGDTNCTR